MKGVSAVIATILMLIITIALAGMAYMYISGVFTSRTQGIEVVDAYCVEGAADYATVVVRNIGTTTIDPTSVVITRTAPTSALMKSTGCTPATGDCVDWVVTSLTPGNTTTANLNCTGTGGRSCHYRLVPPIGGTVTGVVYCT